MEYVHCCVAFEVRHVTHRICRIAGHTSGERSAKIWHVMNSLFCDSTLNMCIVVSHLECVMSHIEYVELQGVLVEKDLPRSGT